MKIYPFIFRFCLSDLDPESSSRSCLKIKQFILGSYASHTPHFIRGTTFWVLSVINILHRQKTSQFITGAEKWQWWIGQLRLMLSVLTHLHSYKKSAVRWGFFFFFLLIYLCFVCHVFSCLALSIWPCLIHNRQPPSWLQWHIIFTVKYVFITSHMAFCIDVK